MHGKKARTRREVGFCLKKPETGRSVRRTQPFFDIEFFYPAKTSKFARWWILLVGYGLGALLDQLHFFHWRHGPSDRKQFGLRAIDRTVRWQRLDHSGVGLPVPRLVHSALHNFARKAIASAHFDSCNEFTRHAHTFGGFNRPYLFLMAAAILRSVFLLDLY